MTSSATSVRCGARRPRVEVAPPSAYTLADPAIELAERAGLRLDPWQRDGLALMLSVRDDDRWACFEYVEMVARQNGKTAGLLAPRALAGLFLLGERLIMWSAHEYKTAQESFRLMQDLIGRLVETGQVEPVKVIHTNGEEGFELPGTKQRLKFIARSKGSGRGFSGDLNLIDEAFAYTPSQQSALMPTMNARPNPQIVYTSSPPLDSESGIPLFGLKARADEGGDGSLGFRDFGAPGDLDQVEAGDVDLDDREMWAATNPALGLRITEETILRNRRSLTTVDFAREICGIWPVAPEEGGRVIRAEQWDPRAAPESQIVGDIVVAIDANPERTRAAIDVCGMTADGRKQVEVIDQDRGLGWVVERCAALNKAHEPLVFVVDPLSPAGPLIPELEAAGLPVHAVTTRQLVAGCGGFYDAVIEGGLVHLGCPVLDAAVAAARKRDVGDGGWAFGRKNSEANIAPLVAAVLAYWGLTEFGGDATGDIW